MFEKIKRNWAAARASVLRKELEDSILRMNDYAQDIHLNASLAMADSYHIIQEKFGALSSMTDKGKKTIAKMLLDKAQGKFDFNVGQGYGLFLLSAYYESSALPGEDAAFVHSVVVEMLESALQVKANFEAVQKTEVV